jgi:hypothetical protein
MDRIIEGPIRLEKTIIFLVCTPWRRIADQVLLAVTITLVTLALFQTFWPQIVLAFPRFAQ